jgi:hypothetical protein
LSCWALQNIEALDLLGHWSFEELKSITFAPDKHRAMSYVRFQVKNLTEASFIWALDTQKSFVTWLLSRISPKPTLDRVQRI